MREWDGLEMLIELGKKRGKLTYDEINNVLPADYIPEEEVEDILDHFQDMGIEVVESYEEADHEEDYSDQKGTAQYYRGDDLVQAYFHSMGDIPVLSRDEEKELSRILEEGKSIIHEMITVLPLYEKLKASSQDNGEGGAEDHEEVIIEALNETLAVLDEIMLLNDYQHAYKETGIPYRELQSKYQRINRVRTIVTQAKNEFITHNLRLVINIAKHYIGRGLALLDLIQEGNIGLMKAIDKFQYRKGFKFSTYATWWIRQSILRALIDQTKTIRVPVHIMELYNKIAKVSRHLISQLGREPRTREIAKQLGITTQKTEDILKAVQDPVTLQTPVGDEESTLEDFIGDDNGSPYDYMESKNTTEEIIKILKTLNPREGVVIRLRYGIGADKTYTLDEIGRYLSITRERVRQIEAKAMSKLKHPQRLSALRILNNP